MCLPVVAFEQAPGKDGKENIRRARKRRKSEAIGGKKFGERDTEERAKRSAEKNSANAIQKNERSYVCQSMYMVSTHSDKLFWI